MNPSIRIQGLLRHVEQRGLSSQEIQVTRSLRLGNIVPILLLLELLPLNNLTKQLSLGGKYFRQINWWRWRLLRSTIAWLPKVIRGTTSCSNHLKCEI